MLTKLRQRLTYANVMSTLAVFIALGGSSYAALTISGSDIQNRSIPAKKLKRNTITDREVRESRLSRVPRAKTRRPARQLHRRRPQGPVPERHVPDRRRLRGADAARRRRSYGSAVLQCRQVGTPAGPGRRLPTHGELMAALTAVTLAPGGRADLRRVSVEHGSRAGLNVLVIVDQVGGVALTPDTAAGAKAYRCVTDPLN